MPLESITGLVLSALVLVLIIVPLFLIVYNLAIGKDTTGTDTKYIANTIEEMMKDRVEERYIQEVYLFNAGKKLIVGFDKSDTVIHVFNKEIPKPETCNEGMCLCEVEGELAKKCQVIEIPENTEAYLVADYRGYDVVVSAKGASVPIAPEPLAPEQEGLANPWRYQHVAIEASLWNSVAAVEDDGKPEAEFNAAEAILPLTIEKNIVTEGNRNVLMITIAPYSPHAQARRWYVQQCPASDNDAACRGLTSYASFGKVGENKICQHDVLKNDCSIIEIPECKDGAVTAACVCGKTFVTNGICKKDVNYDIDCRAITKCSDYCRIGSDASADCSDVELAICNTNPCASKDLPCVRTWDPNSPIDAKRQYCAG